VCASFELREHRYPPSEDAVRHLLRCETTGSPVRNFDAPSNGTDALRDGHRGRRRMEV
jgi:hypothetical protein